MTPAEQEALLLRHVVGLRRRGVAPHVALALAAEGLPAGALRVRVDAARARLARGEDAGGDDPALGGAVALDAVELAADAAEARAWSETALATTRLYGTVAFVLPGLVAAWLGGVFGVVLDGTGVVGGGAAVSTALAHALAWGGLPVALAGFFVARSLGARFAPGLREARAAVALLDAAARGVEPEVDALPAGVHALYAARCVRVGSEVAARDAARELVADARARVALFTELAPLAAALVAAPPAVVGMGALALPLLLTTAELG